MRSEMTLTKKIVTLLVFAVAYVFVNPMASLVAMRLGWTGMGVLGSGLLATLLCLVAYAAWMKLDLIKWENFKLRNWLLALAVGFGGNIVTNLLAGLLAPSNPVNQAAVENLVSRSNPWMSLVVVVFLAPLVEELIFRQLFIKILFPNYQWLGLMISTILFALAHSAASPYEFVLYGMPGLILGGLCWYRGVETSMLWHMTSNGLALAIALYGIQ